jgi:hypothetical protein
LVYGGARSDGQNATIEVVPAPSPCNNPNPITDTAALISEIIAGNNAGSPYTICLENSSYTLTQVNNSSNGDNGLPVITGDITIVGNGATITRDGAAPAFRFFTVDASGSLTLENVTLSNGRSGSGGGAILNEGTLTVINSTLSNNTVTVDDGGAIDNWGTATIENSTFDDNSALDEEAPEKE